ncbi:MAG: hypothetical protein AAF902_21290 [Chloroflexota bacterium]
MKKTVFRKIFYASLWMGLMLLSACGTTIELTYRITGSDGMAEITYLDAEGAEQTEVVPLPWEKTLELSESGNFSVSALREEGTGILCDVLVNDDSLGLEVEAQVYVDCSGEYTIDGNAWTANGRSTLDVLPDGTSALPKVGLDILTDTAAGWEDRLDRVEFSNYEHNQDCTGANPELIATHFKMDYLTGITIDECSDTVQNYANLTGEFTDFGDLFIILGFNNHSLDTNEYINFANTDIVEMQGNFTTLFEEATLRQQTEAAADTITYDYDIFDNTQAGFMRISTIPNFETGAGLNLIFIAPAFSDDSEEEFKLFDAYTSRMINSVEFLDEPLPEPTPTPDPTATFLDNLGNWEDRFARIEFSPYSQNIDCTQFNELFPIQEIQLEVPTGMVFQDCSANPEAYVTFEADMSQFGLPPIIYIVGRVDHPLDLNEYIDFATEAIPGFAQTDIIEPFNGVLADDTPLEIGERLFIRYDYDIVREGNPGFARLVLSPDFVTGQGLFFIMLSPTITEDLDDEYLLFDATVNRVIASARFGSWLESGSESLSSSGTEILESIDPGLDVGHLVVFEDVIEAGGIEGVTFLGTAGDSVFINGTADAEFALALQNVTSEEVVATDSGTDPQVSFTLDETGVYRIGFLNSSDAALDFIGTLEGSPGISFEIQPNFYMIGSYAPNQRLSYLVIDAEAGDELVFQAAPHPVLDLDLAVDIYSFVEDAELLSQDDRGSSLPEDVFYTVGQDGLEPPYVVWVEGVDGEGGIFMLTANINGEGNLNAP